MTRLCSLILRIHNSTRCEWRLRPLTPAELAAPFVAGYRLTPAEPGRPLSVRIALDGAVNCSCPEWNRRERCDHTDALIAVGVLPAQLLALLLARTELLNDAEARAAAASPPRRRRQP